MVLIFKYIILIWFQVVGIFILFFILSGFLYWLVRDKMLITWMNSFHFFVSVIFIFSLILFSNPLFINPNGENYYYKNISHTQLILGLFIWLVAQVIFILNLLLAFFKNKTN